MGKIRPKTGRTVRPRPRSRSESEVSISASAAMEHFLSCDKDPCPFACTQCGDPHRHMACNHDPMVIAAIPAMRAQGIDTDTREWAICDVCGDVSSFDAGTVLGVLRFLQGGAGNEEKWEP